MEKSVKKGINKLKINVLSHIFTYLTEDEIFKSIFQVNKQFSKALKKENIWKELVLRKQLFDDKDNKTSWKEYYIKVNKLKKSIKEGKSNVSFKMSPGRDHKKVITALESFKVSLEITGNNNREIQVYDDYIITGDSEGRVASWNYNVDDEEYQAETVCQFKIVDENLSFSHEVRFIKHYNISKNTVYDEDKEVIKVLVILNKSGNLIVYQIISNENSKINEATNKYSYLKELYNIQTKITEVNQIELINNTLFIGLDTNKISNLDKEYYVESYDILTGKVINQYKPSYNHDLFQQIKQITSSKDDLDKINSINFFNESKSIFDISKKKNCFEIVGEKLIILSNYCMVVDKLVCALNKINNSSIPNLFTFNAYNKIIQGQRYFKISDSIILEVVKKNEFEDLFFTIEVSPYQSASYINLYNVSDLSTCIMSVDLVSSISYVISAFNNNNYRNNPQNTEAINLFNLVRLSNSEFFLIMHTDEKVNKITIGNDYIDIMDVDFDNGDISKDNQESHKLNVSGCIISQDQYKIVIGENNNIRIFDRETAIKKIKVTTKRIRRNLLLLNRFEKPECKNEIKDICVLDYWYLLSCGSSSVVPKSFISHPYYSGAHLISVNTNKIIIAIGNMIRIYNFKSQ